MKHVKIVGKDTYENSRDTIPLLENYLIKQENFNKDLETKSGFQKSATFKHRNGLEVTYKLQKNGRIEVNLFNNRDKDLDENFVKSVFSSLALGRESITNVKAFADHKKKPFLTFNSLKDEI